MTRIKWLDGGEYNMKNSKKFIEFMQMKHPFCEEVNNKKYMRDVRFTYAELYDVDEKAIDISSEDAFIKSFETLGLVHTLK
tara:strand:+ start:1277 stop:1519 length:243 start_codon:yes stop_codon:yes gene_type:complete